MWWCIPGNFRRLCGVECISFIIFAFESATVKQQRMFPLEEEFGLTALRLKCDSAESRIFGFIMYTRRHSYIVKTLEDAAFWNELDEISGPRWPIFAVKPLASGRYRIPYSSMPGSFQMMVQTWVEPNENRKFLEVFSLEESQDLPCLVVFIWNEDDEIEQIVCKLSNRNLEEAFDSIREVVTVISEAEQQILPAYKKTTSLFENVKADMRAHFFHKKITRFAKHLPLLYDFITKFK